MSIAAVETPAPAVQPAVPSGPFVMVSLYVGDLHPTVTESQLFEKFSQAGPVLSIRVCRDAVTRRSLGYAYVNFQQPEHAKNALETMNFDEVNGRQIRIMWSNRDPSTRRSSASNIFIKNLDKSIDPKALYDTFSLFGNILSCKVATDEQGNSKGYGFVHFENEEAAALAIDKVDGMLLADKLVYVAKFKPRSDRLREMGETSAIFTNVFVKNFGITLDTDGLRNLFEKFGEIESCAVGTDSDGRSKGYGFVSFKNPADAAKAVEELNGQPVDASDPEQKLTVCRAQKKSERLAELKERYELFRIENLQRYQGVNLYVKNLDDSVDEEALRKLFAPYGTITSVKVMRDEAQRSRGFGFVCFEKQEEATKAQGDLHGRMVTSKPLYVALAMRKDDRRSYLASQYMQRLANNRFTQGAPVPTGQMFAPAPGGFFVNPLQQSQRNAYMAGPAAPMSAITMGQWNGQPMQQQGRFPVQQQYMMGPRQNVPRQGQTGQRRGGIQSGGMPRQIYTKAPQHGTAGTHQVVETPLDPTVLSQATDQEQKQMLGERIYEKILTIYGPSKQNDVAKLTGMMLEIGTSELLMLLNDPQLFQQRVNEAADVLCKAQRPNK